MTVYTGTSGNITWKYDSQIYTMTISGTGAMSDFTSSGQPWASYISQIQYLSIGEGVTTIGAYAFRGCTSLKNVVFRGNITSIGEQAFYNSNTSSLGVIFLKNTTAPTIGNRAFYSTSSSYTYIGTKGWGTTSVFSSSVMGSKSPNLKTFSDESGTWSNGTSGSGTWSFDADTNVLTISGTGILPRAADDGTQWIKRMYGVNEVKIESGITGLADYCFSVVSNSSTGYMYPPCEKITLPNTLTSIGGYAFNWMFHLKSIAIPDNVTTVGTMCFAKCHSLKDVIIGSSVSTIGDMCFYQCYNYDAVFTFKCSSAPTMGSSAFQLSTSSSSSVTATVYTKGGWGSDDVFTTTYRGNYTTFVYEKLAGAVTHINVGGTWKESVPYVNVGGTWKEVVGVYVNVNGTWKEAQ